MSVIYSAITAPLTTALSISNSAVGLASDVALRVGSVAASSEYSPLAGVIERGVVRVLEKQVKYGRLTLVLPDGREWTSAGGGAGRATGATEKDVVWVTDDVDSSSDDERTSLRPASSASTTTLVSGQSTPRVSTTKLTELSQPAGNASSVPFTGVSITADLKQLDNEPSSGPHVTIRIHSSAFFLRILLSGDLGFAESYMAGECTIETTRNPSQRLSPTYYSSAVLNPASEIMQGSPLLDLFQIIIRSDHPAALSAPGASAQAKREALNSGTISGGLQSLPAAVFSALGRWTTNSRIVNSVRNSVGNIRAHYDISNRMFASFLSKDMTYSCGIYPHLDADLLPSPSAPKNAWKTQDALERSQYAKIHHIIRKAKIAQGHRVLEIGSGWGSFAIEAVRATGCTVDTLTLSPQQKALAEERIAKAGLQESIRVHLMDFRSIPQEWAHSFDRCVSIEMLEAVGKEYIGPYFEMMDRMLGVQGVACFQVITIPEARFATYANTDDFIRKWIFPGGFLPSVSFTTEMIEKGSKGRLVIDSICNIGPHYARTLREWRIRFLENFERDIVPALKDEHPEMSDEDIQVFKRKWICMSLRLATPWESADVLYPLSFRYPFRLLRLLRNRVLRADPRRPYLLPRKYPLYASNIALFVADLRVCRAVKGMLPLAAMFLLDTVVQVKSWGAGWAYRTLSGVYGWFGFWGLVYFVFTSFYAVEYIGGMKMIS